MALPPTCLTWYGDDFTGSTDVLEVLASNGLPAVLFLRTPNADDLAQFSGMRAIGIAGESRSRTPAWMDQHLGSAFRTLRAIGSRIVHYKVCSTFDSSPTTGSIGRALEIGRRELGASQPVPIVVGAPALRRYCAFGNLFATAGSATFRLDRHPTMSRHPVTPMDESDLRRHLALQTSLSVALFDLLALWSSDYRGAFQRLLALQPDAILFDAADERSLERCGELIWEEMRAAGFSVASSGLEYALVAYWRAAGLLAPPPPRATAPAVDRLAVVSGSCSPTTAIQIRSAERDGWVSLAADPAHLADEAMRERECARLEGPACEALASGRSVVVHTACGPDDPRVSAYDRWLRSATPATRQSANAGVGGALGTLLRLLVKRTGIERAVVAGGDTSSAAGATLGIDALTFVAQTSPGSPLCRAHSTDRQIDGMSIVFKGGQVGGPDYFDAVRRGYHVPNPNTFSRTSQ